MKKEEFIARYRAETACVSVSPQLKHRVMEAEKDGERRRKARKWALIPALALCLLLFGAAALAAASRAGLLTFAGRFANSHVPQDALTYMETDVLTLENGLVTAQVREMYYDGYFLRMTVDVKPLNHRTMLLGMDMMPDDRWQNMMRMEEGRDENDLRTAADVYAQQGFDTVYAVEAGFSPALGEADGGIQDYHLNEDGTLTLYVQDTYREALPVREGMFRLYLTPFETPLMAESCRLPEERCVLEAPLSLRQTAYEKETYVCRTSIAYPSAGVRVDEVRMEVLAHEIRAQITATITNRQTFEKMEDGLWFEFIDPHSAEQQPYAQRLSGGMSGMGNVQTAGDRMIQQETLGRNELHTSYTLRAYNCWSKERFESHTFEMEQE